METKNKLKIVANKNKLCRILNIAPEKSPELPPIESPVEQEIKLTLTRQEYDCLTGTADWMEISKTEGLTENFMRTFKKFLKWKELPEYQEMSESFLEENFDLINWNSFFYRRRFGKTSKILSDDFIRRHKDSQVMLEYVSTCQQLSESLIEELADVLDWKYVSQYQTMSEPFMRKFDQKLNFECLSRQNLPESFIKDYWNVLDMDEISSHPLSESFIRAFEHQLDWRKIAECQDLSDSFIIEFKRRLLGRD
jgi:hypothetical protein